MLTAASYCVTRAHLSMLQSLTTVSLIMAGLAHRQVTAVISSTGEPIRSLAWPPVCYSRGSCDTTPATPESLLTDSPDPAAIDFPSKYQR